MPDIIAKCKKALGDLNEKEYFGYVITFLISCIFLYMRAAGSYRMRLFSDDMGCMAVPAFLAGMKWPVAIPMSLYKGFGYYFIFTPLFYFCNDPQFIWFVIVLCNNLVLALASVLAYRICVKQLKFEKGISTAFIVTFGLMCVETTVTFNNEYILYLLTWVVLGCLIKVYQGAGYRWSVLLSLTLGYAYLIHTRSLIYLVGVVAAIGVYCLYHRKISRKIIVLLVTTVIVFAGIYFLREIVINNVWNSAGKEINNTSVLGDSSGYSKYFGFFSLKGIEVFLDMFITNITTVFARTLGIGVLVFGVGGITLYSYVRGKNRIIDKERMLALYFSLFCVVTVMIGLVFLWGKNVISYYPYDVSKKGYKAFSYFRYYATFFGPAIVVALNLCLEKSQLLKKTILVMALPVMICIVYYRVLVVHKIAGSTYINNTFLVFTGNDGTGFASLDFYFFVLWCVFLLIGLFSFCENKKIVTAYMGIVLLLLVGKSQLSRQDMSIYPQMNIKADATSEFVKFVEEYGYEMPDIYCATEAQLYATQYQVYKYPVYLGEEWEEGRHAIVIYSRYATEENEDEWICLDDNEYVMCSDLQTTYLVYDYIEWKNGNR